MSANVVYALVLAAAVAHAAWNAMVKGSADRLLMLTSIRVVGLLAGALAALFVAPPAPASLPFLFGAAAVHYLYYALMLNAYRIGDMSQVYPIARGSAPLLVAVLAAAFAGEMPGPWLATATLLLSGGIFVLAGSGATSNSRAIGFALLTGVAISGYSFLSGLGIRLAGSPLGYIAWLEIATGLGMASVAWLRRGSAMLDFARGHWRAGLLAGLLSVGGYGIVLWAMSMLAMAPVVALRETSVVFAAAMGSLFLREGQAARRIAAAAAVLAGVVMIGFAGRN